MKKEYDHTPPESSKAEEPAIEYQRLTKAEISPPLTEEELNNSMSTEEFKEYWFQCIDEIIKK